MTDWERVRQELKEVGYSGFKLESGETAVPGLSGEWVIGVIPREEGLRRKNQPLLIRVFDALPGNGGAVGTKPENVPESIRNIASRYALEVVIISISTDEARIALCDPSDCSTST